MCAQACCRAAARLVRLPGYPEQLHLYDVLIAAVQVGGSVVAACSLAPFESLFPRTTVSVPNEWLIRILPGDASRWSIERWRGLELNSYRIEM